MKKIAALFLLLCLFSLSVLSVQADSLKGPLRPGYVPGKEEYHDIDFKWEYKKRCPGKENILNIVINNTGEPIEDFTFTFEFDGDKLEYIKPLGDFAEGWEITVKAPHSTSKSENPFFMSLSGPLPSGLTTGAAVFSIKSVASGNTTVSGIDNNGNLTMGRDSFLISQDSAGGIRTLGQLPNGETLPQTGFSAAVPHALPPMPKKLTYEPLNWTLAIPALSVHAEIVQVPYTDNGYPVTWLENRVGLLEGFDFPGEGVTVLAGHNNLNTTELGPFALLSTMETGERIFVLNEEGDILTYTIYANEKISETDAEALNQIASRYENTLTLMTCEDEMISGGFANRRIVAARPIGD